MKNRFVAPAGYTFCSTNYDGLEMKMHALYSKEFSMRDQNGDEVTVQVFNLYHQKKGARPTAIPCSSLINLKRMVASILMKSETLEPRFKTAIEMYMTQATTDAEGALNRVIETFRKAQMGNNVPLGFDLWWEEEPQVLL